jgi:ATP-dependent exoDNAse (exonuclease V) beta subunit
MSRPRDWRERERARDPNQSFIVQAPAGSGKTELLTQRILALLSKVEHPEEVVAITFTRKAAAEMSRRLLERLRSADSAPGTNLKGHEQISQDLALAALRNDRERGWNLLEHPARLRIRTIDSLCSELARQLPVLSGLGGGHHVSENADALYRAAATRTMAAIEDDNHPLQADVTQVLNRYDNQYDRLVDLLTGMLSQRDQWIPQLLSLRSGDGFDRAGLEQSLRILVRAELDSARNAISEDLLSQLPRFFNFALGNSPQDEAELGALMEACVNPDRQVLDLPATPESLPHWLTLVDRLLTKNGQWRTSVNAAAGFPAPSSARGEEKARLKAWKEDYRKLLDHYRDDDSLREQLQDIRSLPTRGYDDESWESLQSLMRLLIHATTEWELLMAETGESDFVEVAARAILALGGDEAPSDLALRMDYRIRHLLVDEFQDTSHSQIRLLEKLTAGWAAGDGRSLFLVGDPMQSIYRFRKAEVSLFIDAFEGRLFRHVAPQPLRLQVNFRSNRPVVDWVNAVFPAVMPAESDPVMSAVSYSPAAAAPKARTSGQIAIHVLSPGDHMLEAQQVIKVIEGCDPEDKVALLVRSRKHAGEIIALLDRLKEQDARFRYRAIDFNPLADASHVRDLISLSLALLQPADRLAWLATLRAPFVGLDLSDLDRLAGADNHSTIAEAIDANLADSGQELIFSASGQQRLSRTGPILLRAADLRGRMSTASLVEWAWNSLGGPSCLDNRSELDDASTYFRLLESLENENLAIDRDTLGQRLKNLYAQPDAEADDGLQLMTIYAAKGLEFDTVILPGLNRETRKERGKLLHWFELAGDERIVLSPMRNNEEKEYGKRAGDLIHFISNVEKRRQSLEDGRLLYVATTRARKNLHLFASIAPNARDETKPASGTLLKELWPAVATELTPRVRQAAGQHETGDDVDPAREDKRLPQVYKRLPSDWVPPAPPPPVELTPSETPELRDDIEFSWAGEDARLTGDLVHRLLQLIAEQGIQHWLQSGGMAVREDWCLRQLAAKGAVGRKAQEIIERTSRAIDNCLDSDRGRWILEAHEKARCEYALTAFIDGIPRNLVLDRSFVLQGVRWIIDYKTSSHSGADLEGFLDNEVERYREQLRRYRDAVALGETRPIRTALYFPMLDAFREVQVDQSE